MTIEEFVNHSAVFVSSLIALGAFVASIFKIVIPSVKAIHKHITAVEEIAKEFRPNGGTTMKDAVNKLGVDMSNVSKDVHDLKEKTLKTAARQWALVATQKDPVFETDADGKHTRFNTTYVNLVERTTEDLIGNGWENTIYRPDADEVMQEWEDAVKKKRAFEMKFRIFARCTSTVYMVECVASPYFDHEGNMFGYIGRYMNIEKQPLTTTT